MHGYNECVRAMQIKEEHRETIVIQKSRFIACVKPCHSEEEARAYIDAIRNEFSDASHVCTAFVVGPNNEIQRSNDNKEPSGTAGVPMLESIKNANIQNVCACVVRYFGGIKLGADGLIRAYAGAVTSALQNATKVIKKPVSYWKVVFPYEEAGTIEQWIRKHYELKEIQYEETITCYFECEEKEPVLEKIGSLSKGSITPEFIETHYVDVIV